MSDPEWNLIVRMYDGGCVHCSHCAAPARYYRTPDKSGLLTRGLNLLKSSLVHTYNNTHFDTFTASQSISKLWTLSEGKYHSGITGQIL